MEQTEIDVLVAGPEHEVYVDTILETIAEAAKVRGTGIAKRTHEYLTKKMQEAKAVIALRKSDGRFAGFSYIETWGNKQYVTTSGLIVHPDFRGLGLAKRIKDMTFTLARIRWPHAKIFSLTSGAAVMAMNTQLGYKPVCRADRRRSLLEGLRGLRQRRRAASHRSQVLHLHRHAVRPYRTTAGQDTRSSAGKN